MRPQCCGRPRQLRGAGGSADAAWVAWKKIDSHSSSFPLGIVEQPITLKLRRPTAEQIERAKQVLEIQEPGDKRKFHKKAESYARQTLRMIDGGEVTLPLQAIRIGDFAAVGIPFETLVEIGLELKERSPFGTTMVIGLANGRYGYLPTPRQHALGGYETWLGTSKVQVDASELIVEQLLKMLETLKKSSGR